MKRMLTLILALCLLAGMEACAAVPTTNPTTAPETTAVEGPFAGTRGLWREVGNGDGPTIEMDGLGGFTMYRADGSVEAEGSMTRVDEYGDGTYRYDLYTGEGEWGTGFYFDSDTQFHIGNGDGPVYCREDAA